MTAVGTLPETLNVVAARRYEPVPTFLTNPALPFYLLLGLPFYWAMGAGFFSFVIASVPMLFQLLLMKPIRIPRGFGLWMLFVGWMLISAVTLEPTVNRFLSFGLRALAYLAASVIFLYVYNIPKQYLSTGRILAVLSSIFVFTAIIGGYAGLILGETRINTPLSTVLPRSLLSNSFVNNVVRPPFAQTQDFLGFPLNRPAMPFSFTNDWAATLVPGSFIAIAAAGRVKRYRRVLPLIAIVAVVPMIISANRGLWIALALGVVYVTLRRASNGQLLMAIRLVLVVLFFGAIILISPLGGLIQGRATTQHSVGARGDIYSDVLEAVPESPLLGYGAPLANPNPNRPAIGTHGMFWTALFSQGIPGTVMYAGFWIGMSIRTGRRIRNQEQLWLHLAVISALPTMLYYDHIPAALPMMLIAAATILRDRQSSEAERARAFAEAAPAIS